MAQIALSGVIGALSYALLLKDAGCSANANRTAALFAVDERPARDPR